MNTNVSHETDSMKGISIITDFGCQSGCPYCIWRDHRKYLMDTERQISSLDALLKERTWIQKFSVSGGGDPLNLHPESRGFYDSVHRICREQGKKYDIHTSYSPEMILSFFRKHPLSKDLLNRIVFHASRKRVPHRGNLMELLGVTQTTNLRLVYVVTDELDVPYLQNTEKTVIKHFPKNTQLSYRELVGDRCRASLEVQEFCKRVSERMENGKFIEQKDYNTYIMPDGSIRDVFLC